MASRSVTGGNCINAFGVIAEELSRVKTLMERQLGDCDGPVREFAGHIGFGKGKMIRSGLVLLSGRAFGRVTKGHVRTAAIIEMIHNATLLHDDVIDEGKSRRGIPTLNTLKGNESAVLMGDFLLSRVFNMCIGLDKRAMEIISSATAQTCEGELKQITQRGNWGLSEAEYISIIAEKTGAFFSAACALGAMQAGAGPSQIEALSEYGRKTGIAFQITDDLLDLTGDRDKTGKPTGSDLNEHKVTLPVIRLLDVADKKDKELARKVLCEWQEKGRANNRHRKNLLTALRRYDCLSYAQKRAGEFVERAVEAIKGLGPNSEADGLVEVARFVVNRVS